MVDRDVVTAKVATIDRCLRRSHRGGHCRPAPHGPSFVRRPY